jgi:dTMP kinase
MAEPSVERATEPSRRGFFLSLDGPDGGGKSTQAARLVARLRAVGHEVIACRDPGGTALGDRLRSLLLDHDEAGLSIGTRAEMLLYMASRAQLVEEVIAPALAAGKVVVSDRFLLANVVYQGHAGGLEPGDVWGVGLVATGGLLPDLTLVLDVPPDVAAARRGGARDRMEARPDEYHRRVRSGFLRELKSRRAPFLLIDASAEADVVAAKIWSEVERALGRRAGT